jgi:hypothetical protein
MGGGTWNESKKILAKSSNSCCIMERKPVKQHRQYQNGCRKRQKLPAADIFLKLSP